MVLVHKRTRQRAHRLPAVWRGMLWMVASGIIFSFLNSVLRWLSMNLDVYQTQFLRYSLGIVVMLPFLFRAGWPPTYRKTSRGNFGEVPFTRLHSSFGLPHCRM